MQPHDIVVIGASAGGVEALSELARGLPADLPAAVFVTVHFPAASTSVLPNILSRAGALPAVHAEDRMPIERGTIYVAPPDRHLILAPDGMRLVRGPQENGNRPAIDPMFRSAAVAFGARVVGVVLTGNLDDGTSGLLAIKRRGGLAVVQDPDDALFPSMPRSALKYVDVDRTAPIARLGPLLGELTGAASPVALRGVGKLPEDAAMTERDGRETAYAELDMRVIEDPEDHPGHVSPYSCPDCGGVLWELQDGEMVRFRCRVGHAWTADALVDRQADTLDAALWTALRALEERAALSRQMAARMRARDVPALAERLDVEARVAERRAHLIRGVLVVDRDGDVAPTDATDAPDPQGEKIEQPTAVPGDRARRRAG